MDVKYIVDSWTREEPIYKKIGEYVTKMLATELSDSEMMPEISSRTKELLSLVRKIKKKEREKNYSYEEVRDKLGIRIICTFESELEVVDSILKKNFEIKKNEYKKKDLDFNILDYQSNHYDVCLKKTEDLPRELESYISFIFEVQVRTQNQHAWSMAAHKLSYKQDSELPIDIKRKLYRLLALYELSDQEIETFNTYLKKENCNDIFKILQRTEGKLYKYAKIDYDKDYSIDNLKLLAAILGNKKISTICENIEKFIEDNHAKIQFIFDTNRDRFHEMSFLTQPEIFIIWYALERFEYSLVDQWNNYFDSDDLDYIRILWGKIIE
mgnify:CR=1 FL=1